MKTEQQKYLTTGEIGRAYDVRADTVSDWMTVGVVVRGRRIFLQHKRIGKYRKAMQAWVDAFMAELAGGEEARPTADETTTERDRRAKKDMQEARREMAR